MFVGNIPSLFCLLNPFWSCYISCCFIFPYQVPSRFSLVVEYEGGGSSLLPLSRAYVKLHIPNLRMLPLVHLLSVSFLVRSHRFVAHRNFHPTVRRKELYVVGNSWWRWHRDVCEVLVFRPNIGRSLEASRKTKIKGCLLAKCGLEIEGS